MTKEDKSIVELFVSDKIYKGWKATEMMLDLESLAHYASLECAYTEEDDVTIKNGEKCELKIDGTLILTGYIDRTEYSVTGDSFDLNVEIRSKTSDLIDCSAGYQQIKNRDAKSIAEEICKPFGIKVQWKSKKPARKITWKIEPMDTCFDVLTMIARECNVILTTNGEGHVLFTDAGDKNVGTLVLGEDILRLQFINDWTMRFSDYICCGDNQSYRDDWKGGESTVLKKGNAKTTVKDKEINRYRPNLMMTDDVASGENTKEKAEFERDRAISMGKEIVVRLRSWYNKDKLWEINQCLNVTAPPVVTVENWLITEISFILNGDDGYVAEIKLSPPEGFGGEPTDKKSSDKKKKGAGAGVDWK